MEHTKDYKFSGSVPGNYDHYLGPILFESFAVDIAERLRNNNAQKVLELACGTGRVTNHLLSVLPPGAELIATDLNPDMLAIAQKKVPGENVIWQVVNAQDIPFEAESFDVVVCQFGVMFFPDKAAAFAEIQKVLKRDGRFLFNTWDSLDNNPVNLIVDSVLKEVLKSDAPDFMEKGPFSFFNKELITQMLADAVFTNITVDTVQKNVTVSDPENIVKGFVTGSPLAAYLMEKDPKQREEITRKMNEQITAQYGQTNIKLSLQAIVCSAQKL